MGRIYSPKISIITPSFNQGKYLERTILSILEQNYDNLEYLIVDGESTDNSIAIIRKYEKHITYWVSEPDRGQSHAINKGIEKSTGEILIWLNSDDYIIPGALEIIAEMYLENPHAGAYVGAGEFVDKKGRVLVKKSPSEITLESLYNWLINFQIMQPSCYVTREAWNAVGGLNETIHFAMDLDLWLRIIRHYRFKVTDSLLSRSLVHRNAKTAANRYFCEVETALVIMNNGGDRQGRDALNRIAAKLELYEKIFRIITDNRLFNSILPSLKTITDYDRKISRLYPRFTKPIH